MALRQRKYFGSVAPSQPDDKDDEPEPAHEYSSLQVQITGQPATAIRKMGDAIPDKDLQADEGSSYGGASVPDGREHEPHITCRWGLHFQTPTKRLRNAIKDFGPIQITFGKTSLFTGDKADVLKVDIVSPDLHQLYALIGRIVPTHTTFPDYRPHATICYLRPGRGKKYAGNATLAGQKITATSIVFSGKRGHRETLPLTSGSTGPFRVR